MRISRDFVKQSILNSFELDYGRTHYEYTKINNGITEGQNIWVLQDLEMVQVFLYDSEIRGIKNVKYT